MGLWSGLRRWSGLYDPQDVSRVNCFGPKYVQNLSDPARVSSARLGDEAVARVDDREYFAIR